MVTGYGIIGLIVMCMSMDIGQDQDRDVLMKQVIGKANHVVNTGSKVAGTNKRKHQDNKWTQWNYNLYRGLLSCHYNVPAIFIRLKIFRLKRRKI